MTILEQLQSVFPDVEGIGDARNIAEALAMISGAGGRGANTIADKVSNPGGGGSLEEVFDAWAMTGSVPLSQAIGKSATMISDYAFSNIGFITEASFPNASYIGNNAFQYCYSLTSISFPNASYIGSNAFHVCHDLSDASFPNASYIGSNAFGFCSGLTSVSFPNASYIGNYAFTSCCNLTTVSFPNVSYIGDYAFNSCYNLISLYLTGGEMSTVPTLSDSYAFDSTPIGGYSASAGQYGSVYVPASLYESFLSADNWSSIASRIVSVSES